MWTVRTVKIGRLHVALGTSPRGVPFALFVAWARPGRRSLVICDWGVR